MLLNPSKSAFGCVTDVKVVPSLGRKKGSPSLECVVFRTLSLTGNFPTQKETGDVLVDVADLPVIVLGHALHTAASRSPAIPLNMLCMQAWVEGGVKSGQPVSSWQVLTGVRA